MNKLILFLMMLVPTVVSAQDGYGVIHVSVADAREEADYAAEMGTQVLLGHPVRVYEKTDDLWRVETPEGYIAWVMNGTLTRLDKAAFNAWTVAPKVIFTDDYGFAYETPNKNGQRASDIVFGDLLKYEGKSGPFYKVSYPDGRQGYVLKTQSKLFADWQAGIQLTEESIVQTALTLKGIPYVWGGTSPKGLDCSGFAKTVFLKHGIILQRNASQQARNGTVVDISAGYDNLRPGDLLFFGKKTEDGQDKVRHVAIYIGDKEFIHASGYIRINSLDPASPAYDGHNTAELLRARRVLGAVGTEGIWKISDNPLYKAQE
ncbi:cytochrome c [Bacteroidia bacterium]|nr:cytochrome c [Bacteroidia bacterium]